MKPNEPKKKKKKKGTGLIKESKPRKDVAYFVEELRRYISPCWL